MKFRIIKDFPNYAVSKSGIILNRKTRRRLISRPQNNGYKMVFLYNGDIRKNLKISYLVATAYIPNPENKRCVNHKDGNKLNDNDWNLEWSTHAENTQHAYDMGLISRIRPVGRSNKNSRILRAYDMLKNGKLKHKVIGQEELAVKLNTSKRYIRKYLNKNKLLFKRYLLTTEKL